jgi:hypothetical protein
MKDLTLIASLYLKPFPKFNSINMPSPQVGHAKLIG